MRTAPTLRTAVEVPRRALRGCDLRAPEKDLPPWAQWGIQGSKLLLAFSPIIILIVILVRAFESDEEVRFVSCCFSYPPRGGSRFAAAQIADAGAHFRRYTGESEAKKEDGLPGP